MNLLEAVSNLEADEMQEELQKAVAECFQDNRIQIFHILATRFLVGAITNEATLNRTIFTEFVTRVANDPKERTDLMAVVS